MMCLHQKIVQSQCAKLMMEPDEMTSFYHPDPGTNSPGEPYRLPHPSVYEATGERIPVHHLRNETGTFLDASTHNCISVISVRRSLDQLNQQMACVSVFTTVHLSMSLLSFSFSIPRRSMQQHSSCRPLLPQTWDQRGVQHLPPRPSTPHTCAPSSSCLETARPTAPWPCSTSAPAMRKR